MPCYEEIRIRSLRKFVALVERQMADAGNPLWYRGCGKVDYKLVPSIYRHPTATTISGIIDLEVDLMNRFYHRSRPFLSNDVPPGWESLFLAQHYGIPTRLLDWSENPLMALYFALTSAPHHYDCGSIVFDSDIAVWVFNPIKWNRQALNNQAISSVLGVDDDPLKGYAPTSNHRQLNVTPVALYGIHNSHRIVAQRGTFTIFGQDIRPMEETYINAAFPAGILIKIILQKGFLPKIYKSLFSIGITDSVVFPDLDGLAKELKRHFNFEV